MSAAAAKKGVVTLSSIPKWPAYFATNKLAALSEGSAPPSNVNETLNQKVSIWQGDITLLEIDAIVNAANSKLEAGGGVCGSIFRGAGDQLATECAKIAGCPAGEARLTGGYNLPAKYVIHAVGPQGEFPEVLKSTYANSFKIMMEKGLRSIAFPCISTGVYGYPNDAAADVALSETRKFLDGNGELVDRVIFAVFMDKDKEIYEKLMQKYFPLNV